MTLEHVAWTLISMTGSQLFFILADIWLVLKIIEHVKRN